MWRCNTTFSYLAFPLGMGGCFASGPFGPPIPSGGLVKLEPFDFDHFIRTLEKSFGQAMAGLCCSHKDCSWSVLFFVSLPSPLHLMNFGSTWNLDQHMPAWDMMADSAWHCSHGVASSRTPLGLQTAGLWPCGNTSPPDTTLRVRTIGPSELFLWQIFDFFFVRINFPQKRIP
jgi:hypothetical protein